MRSPREEARERARRGCLRLGRLFLLVALVEIAAAAVRAIADPEPTPAVLGHLAGAARAVSAGIAAWIATRFVPLGKAIGLRPMALAACVFFALSSAVALAPLFEVVPAAMSDRTFDSLAQLLRAAAFVAGACLVLLVARAIAEREGQPFIARHLAWTVMPLCVALPVAFQAIDPALSPSPWVGPALALALPWAMVLVGLMRWDFGVWATLAVGAIAGTLLFGEVGVLTLPGLAISAVVLLAAIAASGALHELAPSLAVRGADTISRTLIRRLFDGTLGGEGSRVGDVDPDASKPPRSENDEKAEDAEHLARALRELGIETDDRAPAAETDRPMVIAPLVPKSGPNERPRSETPEAHAATDERLAPVVMLPSALAGIDRGLRRCFAAFIARALVVVFGLLWAKSPIADLAPVVVLFDLALIASSALLALGLDDVRRSPVPPLHRPAGTAFVLAALLVLADIALALVRFADVDRSLLIATDGLLGVMVIAAFLVTVMRLGAELRQEKIRGRARGSLVLLALWTGLGAAAVIAGQLPASDLQWLAWPLGFATAAVGLGLWIALLWLTRDAQDALRP